MILKRFTPAGREEFLAMCHDFYNSGAALDSIPQEQMAATFDKAAAGSPYVIGFFLEEDGQTAGYGLTYPFYSNEAGCLCAMLDEIYVKPEFRSHKLGTQYLETVAAAISPEVKGLKLEICFTNDRAKKLYEKMGFKPLNYGIMIKSLEK